ncbi:hypothetical protein C6501_13050 [Candidatus Poribacteria bacterium]|nr:MAG: hypothetical protein C6501_13050 [Candidatus Poribacteria bacterium]
MQQPPIVEYVAPQAREQGIQQGAKETTRKHILQVLTQRLQLDATQTIKPILDEIEDIHHLDHLFNTAMQVDTAEDFMQALNENSE